MRRQGRCFVQTAAALGWSLSLTVGQAGAQTTQDDTQRAFREAIVSSTTAYLPLPTEYVCPGGSNLITPSPDRKDVVILRAVSPPVRTLAALTQKPEEAAMALWRGEPFALQMLLLSSGDDHAQVVWRGGSNATSGLTMPDVPRWLPGSRLALVQTTTLSGRLMGMMSRMMSRAAQGQAPEEMDPSALLAMTTEMTRGLLLLNTATGKTQTLVDSLEDNANVIVSTTDPVAAIVQTDEKTGRGIVRRIGADGKPGGAVSFVKPEGKVGLLYWTGFLPDNKTLTGILYESHRGEQSESDAQPDTRAVYELDTLTGAVTKSTSNTVVPGALPSAATNAEMPYTVIREKQTVTRDGVATTIHPLWLESRDKTFVGRTLIAADSDTAVEPVVLQSAVLYQYKGSVYSVPLLKSSAPEFLAQRREVQKRETLSRAQQIGGALLMYAQENNACLPPVGSNLSTALVPYLKDDTVFQNPVTGNSDFTALYKSVGLAAYKTPAEMPLGTLHGPGGMAVLFADGQVKWKDDGSGKP